MLNAAVAEGECEIDRERMTGAQPGQALRPLGQPPEARSSSGGVTHTFILAVRHEDCRT